MCARMRPHASRRCFERRARDPDFAERWDDAIADALAQLEARVFNAAREGDMQSARWLLARRLPAIYGEQVALEHSGGDERSISVTPAREVIIREVIMPDIPPDIPEETVESLESLVGPRFIEWIRNFSLVMMVWLGWTLKGCVS